MRRRRYLPLEARAPDALVLSSLGRLASATMWLGTWLGVFVVSASLTGCGPIQYMSQVSSRAAVAVAQAKAADAERYAPYAYTTAEMYLEKAREEGGQAQYQIAIEYGRRAEEMATRARLLAEQKGSQVEYTDGVVGAEPPPISGDNP